MLGLVDHLIGVGTGDGHADARQSQGQQTWRVRRSRIHSFVIKKSGATHPAAQLGAVLNDGELLQGLNYLCNNGLSQEPKTCAPLWSKGAQHPRNLDPPLPACYLATGAFPIWHLASFLALN